MRGIMQEAVEKHRDVQAKQQDDPQREQDRQTGEQAVVVCGAPAAGKGSALHGGEHGLAHANENNQQENQESGGRDESAVKKCAVEDG